MHFNHHTLMSLLKRVIQLWTDRDVPSGVETTHDFKDGRGAIPAVPVDVAGVRNDAISTGLDYQFTRPKDDIGIKNDVVSIGLDYQFIVGTDGVGVKNDVISTVVI